VDFIVIERTNPPSWASTGRLDLNDVGAEVSENLAAQDPAFIRQI
jgi:hypothetical protein